MVKNRVRFDYWWLVGILLVGGLVALAIIINNNYAHNGDNASNISGSIDIDNGDTKINWERYPSYEAELSETYTITSSGTYNLTGEIKDGAIIVKADAEAVIRIVLNNVKIKNSNGPAIACYMADDLVINLQGDNYLEDGTSYTSDWDDDVTGVIYAKSDLSFDGEGTLTLKGNYADGIVGKDDLTFRNGTYEITANDDGIRGKDSIHIENGDFTIRATGDGFKSTNETDSTKGFILVENGSFDIVAKAKGLKATNSIIVYGGNFELTTTDDAIHTNNYVGIIDGIFKIVASDDGIHADARLIVDGGTIDITKSYEGLEAQKISINSGKLLIVANDDGINAGGGTDNSAKNRPGAGAFDADENCEISINGGEVYINAAGDGIDSNGWLYFNNGKVVVDGPTNNGNGALDAGAGIIQSGGTVIAIGASGMAESLGTTSSVYNVSIYLTSTLPKGTKIEIKDASDELVVSHTSAKSFNHLAIGTTKFKKDQTYTLYLNDSKYESFTISNTTTTVGSGVNNFQNMGPGPRRM